MCYSLWYNAPTMLPAFGRQHRRDSKLEGRPGHQTDGWMRLGKVSLREARERGGNKLTDRPIDDQMDGRKQQRYFRFVNSVQRGEIM